MRATEASRRGVGKGRYWLGYSNGEDNDGGHQATMIVDDEDDDGEKAKGEVDPAVSVVTVKWGKKRKMEKRGGKKVSEIALCRSD